MRKPCCDKQDTSKGAWSKQEDQKLIDYIRTHGEGCWRSVPRAAGLLRCGKSCRLRWINYLRPDVKRGNFAEDEEDLIIKLHALLGNRWSLIAGRLPGRTDNEVKNYWNSHLRRKIISMGINPKNHRGSNILPLRQPQSSGSAPFSGNSGTHKHKECQHLVSLGDNDRVSDAASYLEDNSCMLPDLNLDLTMSLAPPPLALMEQRQESEELRPQGLENTTLPTLLLFR